jgi:hypothetical protein
MIKFKLGASPNCSMTKKRFRIFKTQVYNLEQCFSGLFCLVAPLMSYIYLYLAAPLDVKIGLKFNKSDNWRHTRISRHPSVPRHPGWEPLISRIITKKNMTRQGMSNISFIEILFDETIFAKNLISYRWPSCGKNEYFFTKNAFMRKFYFLEQFENNNYGQSCVFG